MKFYKFANGIVVNIDNIKNKLISINKVEEGYLQVYSFGIILTDTGISIDFDNEILAKEQRDAFILFLEQNC
jgi:hypothetical protein